MGAKKKTKTVTYMTKFAVDTKMIFLYNKRVK